jgi:hypothetical protein
MTEYDYSPAAYDRFMESQSRVGRWVDNANEHSREFVNPFVPSHSDPAEKSDFYSSSSHRRSKSTSVKQSATRSFAVPEQRDHDYGHRSSHHHRSGYSSNTRSSSSSSGTSSTTTYTARPHNSRSYTVPQHPSHGAHVPLAQPVRSRTMPHGSHYELDPRGNGAIMLPRKPGQTYVIMPPHGQQLNVVVSTSFAASRLLIVDSFCPSVTRWSPYFVRFAVLSFFDKGAALDQKALWTRID